MNAPAGRRRRSPLADDRQGLPRPVLVLAATSTALSMGLATMSVPSPSRDPLEMLLFGMAAALLGTLVLRSLPLRRVMRSHVVVGALLAGRLGIMWGGTTATLRAVAWIGVSVVALALAAQLDHLRRPEAAPVRRAPRRPAILRVVGGVAVLAAGVAMLAGPSLASAFPEGASIGELADQMGWRRDNALAAAEQLDMTSRPRLSDAVVFTVTADRASFWRTANFDRWDGRNWTRTDDALRRVGATGAVLTDPFDIAAETGVAVRQEFRVESSFANALPMAPAAVVIDAPTPLAQWGDGNVLAQIPLGRGSTYTVQSRLGLPTEAALRASAEVGLPEGIRRRYAAPPPATERTRALARTIAEGAATDLDRVRAVERWLGANTRYSLDAPLSPSGVDVVDHFLFTSRLGWCEQVSSSMVVLLRSVGVPARLATGFVPGDRDPISGRYTVRERDAHAWTEVWFPGVGWVPFDPTASVPLAGEGEASSSSGLTDGWLDGLATVLVVAGLVLVAFDGLRGVVGTLCHLVRRLVGRRIGSADRVDRSTAASPAVVRLERELDAVGSPVVGDRSPAETATTYAARLAVAAGSPSVVEVGAAADAARYGSSDLDDERSGTLVALLHDAVARPPG